MVSEKAVWLKQEPYSALLLTSKQKSGQVKWAHGKLNENWENVRIFDGSTFQSYKKKLPVWYQDRCANSVSKHSPKSMIWETISSGDIECLSAIEKAVISPSYKSIINGKPFNNRNTSL